LCRPVTKFCYQNLLLIGRVEEGITFRSYQFCY